jgi:hypothetical protein
MSGTPNSSIPLAREISLDDLPDEEEISLDLPDEEEIIIVDEMPKDRVPLYFECSPEFGAFSGDYVEDKESSKS